MHELGHLLFRRGFYISKHLLEEEVSAILFTYLAIADGNMDEAEKVARDEFRKGRPLWSYSYRDHLKNFKESELHVDWRTARQKTQELFDGDLSRNLVKRLLDI